MLLVLRTPKVVTAQHCWGLLGALALLAYWGALDAVVGSLTCPYLPLLAFTRPYHYSLPSSILSVSVFRCVASDPGE